MIKILTLVFVLIRQSLQSDPELCQNPSVYSVDRLENKTVRFYRENNYWELSGFPDQISVTKGSMKHYEFFNPVNKTHRIVTILEGSDEIKGRIFKFGGQYWWSWEEHPKFGVKYIATSVGFYWDEAPLQGFAAIFHNGDPSEPMLIGLEADRKSGGQYMKVHYFSTETSKFVSKSSDYYDEKDFPIDMTDAFSWPPSDGSKYNVYITKEDNYCLVTDQQKCEDWKPISELIGCTGASGGAKPSRKPGSVTSKPMPPGNPSKESPGGSEGSEESTEKPEDGDGNESGEQSGEPEIKPGGQKPGKKTTPRTAGAEDKKNKTEGIKGSRKGGSDSIQLSIVSIILSYICLNLI